LEILDPDKLVTLKINGPINTGSILFVFILRYLRSNNYN
jgi:hypothetical protein